MRKRILAGLGVLVVWSLGFSTPAVWAQSIWPSSGSSSGSSGNPYPCDDCGVPPPLIDDPSPGDGNECWIYISSGGWTRLFNCVGETNCPTVSPQGGNGNDCACLSYERAESKHFNFYPPFWGDTDGTVECKPDNPACGDADITSIETVKIPWWTAAPVGSGVCQVSPEMGVGNAAFSVFTHQDAGDDTVQVTWHLGLEMDGITTCPTNFDHPGPTVDAIVYVVTTDFPETEECPELEAFNRNPSGQVPQYPYDAFGYFPEPDLDFSLEPFEICNFGGECKRYRITGGAYLELEAGWYVTDLEVKRKDCANRNKGDLIDRTTSSIDRTKAHELIHCLQARMDINEINQSIVRPALDEIFSSRRECEDEIKILKEKIRKSWKEKWKNNETHCSHVGFPKYEKDGCGNEYLTGTYSCGDL